MACRRARKIVFPALIIPLLLSAHIRTVSGQAQSVPNKKGSRVASNDDVFHALPHFNVEKDKFHHRVFNPEVAFDDFQNRGTTPFTKAARSADEKQPAWVRNYSSGLLSGSDSATDLAVDSFGNIYVTGVSEGAGTGYDFVTIKYSPTGEQEWAARLAGPGIAMDSPTAVAVDDLGNTYVTGSSDGNYLTVKYSPDGVELWSAICGGLSDGVDGPASVKIEVDRSGNVYVAGTSRNPDMTSDYATIKYSSEGKERWVAHYNEDQATVEYLTDLDLDNSDNIYETGISWKSGSFFSIATIKYDPTGKALWVSSYGSGSLRVADMEVDSAGNCYLAGYRAGPAEMNKYITIKYDTKGKMQWERVYDYARWGDVPADLVLDHKGNVYVTGYSFCYDSLDTYATVKYSASGELQWSSRSSCDDRANALASDNVGNVYVLGRNRIAKYDSTGIEQWNVQTAAAQTSALAIDIQGSIFIAGSRNSDLVVLKYDGAATERWHTSYDGTGTGYDAASDIVLDDEGNVYVTGHSRAAGNNYDYATIKYSPDGNEQWIARYDSPRQGRKWPVTISVDKDRNVYVTGNSELQDISDIATIKYNPLGEEEWAAVYAGPANAVGVAADDSGNVYVAGNSHDDYLVAKYDINGAEQWVSFYDGINHGQDKAAAIGIDPLGNVYVTGKSQSESAFDIATIKFNTSGNQQWAARYALPMNFDCQVAGMAIDDSGKVYVTATVANQQSYRDISSIIIKYNSNGREEWVAIADTACASVGIALDDSGNVYMATTRLNWMFDWPYGERLCMYKYNSGGEKKWRTIYDNGFDFLVSDLAIDGHGNAYVFGTTSCCGDVISMIDYLTVKFNADGTVGWTAQYDNGTPDYFINEAVAIAADKTGNVYVTGNSWFEDFSAYTTIKYAAESTISVPKKRNNLPADFLLKQNYPNPFNPSTTISYELPVSGLVALEIFNLMGQKVRTLIDRRQQVGSHQTQWDGTNDAGEAVPSGVYFYRLQSASSLLTGKAVLMR